MKPFSSWHCLKQASSSLRGAIQTLSWFWLFADKVTMRHVSNFLAEQQKGNRYSAVCNLSRLEREVLRLVAYFTGTQCKAQRDMWQGHLPTPSFGASHGIDSCQCRVQHWAAAIYIQRLPLRCRKYTFLTCDKACCMHIWHLHWPFKYE